MLVKQTLRNKKIITFQTLVLGLLAIWVFLVGFAYYQVPSLYTQIIKSDSNEVTSNVPVKHDVSKVQSSALTKVQTESSTINDLSTFLQSQGFYIQSDTTFSQRKNNDMWWVSVDNWSILGKSSGQMGLVKPSAKDEVGINITFTQQLIEELNKFFIDRGFEKNLMNSSKSTIKESNSYGFSEFYDYIRGWENEEEKCLLTINIDNGSYQDEVSKEMVPNDNIYIQCMTSSNFMNAYQNQHPFLMGLNERELVIRNLDVKNDVASMSIGWRRTGAMAFMYKTIDGWKVIAITQEIPACSELRVKKVPKKYWIECYKDENGAETEPAGDAWK